MSAGSRAAPASMDTRVSRCAAAATGATSVRSAGHVLISDRLEFDIRRVSDVADELALLLMEIADLTGAFTLNDPWRSATRPPAERNDGSTALLALSRRLAWRARGPLVLPVLTPEALGRERVDEQHRGIDGAAAPQSVPRERGAIVDAAARRHPHAILAYWRVGRVQAATERTSPWARCLMPRIIRWLMMKLINSTGSTSKGAHQRA
jgi:hypothetical protein